MCHRVQPLTHTDRKHVFSSFKTTGNLPCLVILTATLILPCNFLNLILNLKKRMVQKEEKYRSYWLYYLDDLTGEADIDLDTDLETERSNDLLQTVIKRLLESKRSTFRHNTLIFKKRHNIHKKEKKRKTSKIPSISSHNSASASASTSASTAASRWTTIVSFHLSSWWTITHGQTYQRGPLLPAVNILLILSLQINHCAEHFNHKIQYNSEVGISKLCCYQEIAPTCIRCDTIS